MIRTGALVFPALLLWRLITLPSLHNSMVRKPQQLNKDMQGWAAFTPAQFAEHGANRFARDILLAITEINDILLSFGSNDPPFAAIAQVCADILNNPLVSILLFDSEQQILEVAGINHAEVNLLIRRRGHGMSYRTVLPLDEHKDLDWLRAVREGNIFVTTKPHEIASPFVPAGRARSLMRRLGILQGITLPLFVRGKLVGVMAIGQSREAYAPGERTALLALAHHVALASEMWRLNAAATRQAIAQKTLAESARMIARAETAMVLQAIVQAGSALVMDSQFGILLPQGDVLTCLAAYGPQTEKVLGFNMPMGEGLVGQVYKSHKPLLVADVQTTPGSARHDIDDAADFHSWMAVPMLTERGCIGVLVASHSDYGLYNATHLELLDTLADHAAIALEKSRLLQEAQRKVAEQSALVESAHAVAHLDVQTVLSTLVAKASAIVKASRCNVLLHDSTTDTLRWAAGVNTHTQLRTEALASNRGLVGHVFSTGEPVLVDDITLDPRSESRHIEEASGARSFLCVPLRSGSSVLGVLVAVHHDAGVFTRHDLSLLSAFADYASIALANARLYASLQQREAERAFLLRRLLAGQEVERRRVAVDIHDGPMQSIGVNILAIDRARKLLEVGQAVQARDELVSAREAMSAIVQELRDVINGLRPVALENLGLMPAVTAHLSLFTEQTGVKTHLEDKLDGYRLPAAREEVYFRLLQEALTNVRKHANAESVWVTFTLEDKVFRMSVTDNGNGFDQGLLALALENGHIGIQSMQERIEAAGGGMDIQSDIGMGTRLTFWHYI